MSPDDRLEMEQFEALSAELADAGRVARAVSARLEAPDQAFAARLRAQLLGGLSQPGSIMTVAAALPARRQLNSPEDLADRRRDASRGTQATPPRSGKRWRARQVETIRVPEPVVLAEIEPNAAINRETALKPSIRWRMPTRSVPSRWVAVGLAAAIAIASFAVGSTVIFPAGPTASAKVAIAASVVRNGALSPLAAGAELREGDTVEVGAGGEATLAMGGSYVRMAPGSDLRLDRLDSSHIVVNQLSGRAYHRVSVGSHGDYTVITAAVTWVATGTAFDLDRYALGTGGEEVRGMALLDGLDVTSLQDTAALNQGQSAVVDLSGSGSTAGTPVVSQITTQALSDSWLVQNASLDSLAGLDVGELAVAVTPAPRPTRTAAQAVVATPRPTAPPTKTPTPTPTPTPSPTPKPTPKPTPRPTPRPTRTGPLSLGALAITDNGDGTYTFSWPEYQGEGFTYYKLVHGDAGTVPRYPSSPYWACNSDRTQNSWTGPIDPGDYAVRLQVVDESSGSVVIRAQTNIAHLQVAGGPPTPTPTLPALQDLGALNVSDDGGGKFTFSWAAYTGGWSFDAYKLVYVAWDGDPSYLTGASYKAFGTGSTSSGSIPMPSGDWSVRVQAIGRPSAGDAYAFAATSVYHLTVP
jgi:hypothetical protein